MHKNAYGKNQHHFREKTTLIPAGAMIEMSMLTNMTLNMTAFDAVYPEESIAHKGY